MLRTEVFVPLLLLATTWAGCESDVAPCAAATPCDAGFEIATMSDLAEIEACSSVQGNLVFVGDELTHLDLPCLAEIEGGLRIDLTGGLVHLDMHRLQEVGQDFRIYATGDFPSLAGLSTLTTVGRHMVVHKTRALSSLAGLTSMASIGGDLVVECNSSLSQDEALAFAASIEVGGETRVNSNGHVYDYICGHEPYPNDDDDDDYTPQNDDDDDDDDSSACTGDKVDCDGDGFDPQQGDCDDADPTTHPGATELCDATDNDCDGHQDDRCWTHLAAGSMHTCGIRLSGETECWGADSVGQSSPPAGLLSAAITAGTGHSCAVQAFQPVCWGCGFSDPALDQGQCAPPYDVVPDVHAGAHHTCTLSWGGSTHCWGASDQGQTLAPGLDFDHLSLGTYHSCGVAHDGTAHCWGCADPATDYGQCIPPAGTYTQVEAGLDFSCALLSDVTSPPAGPFVHLTAGTGHACGITATGDAQCWGLNWDGQCIVP